MKKIISILLIMLMMLTLLTGCGANISGFAKMLEEMSDIKQFEFTNNVNLVVNEGVFGEPITVEAAIEGVANVEYKEDLYAIFDVTKGIFNGFDIKEKVGFRIEDSNLYITTNIFNVANEFYITQGDIDPTFEEQYSEIRKYDYWLVSELGENIGVKNIEYVTEISKTLEIFKKGLNGYDTNLIEKINGGYKVDITSDKLNNEALSLLKFVENNSEQAYDAYVALVEELGREPEENVRVFFENISANVKPEEINEMTDMVKGSKLTMTLVKKGDIYEQIVYLKLVINGEDMGLLESTTTIKEATVTKEYIGPMFLTSEMIDIIVPREVTALEIEWTNASNETKVTVIDSGNSHTEEMSNYVLIDNRVYLPLRYIGETLGEEVGWDNDLRQAYVLRNGEKIDMTGVIVNDKTMVKIRDFEKLGYTVGYVQENGVSKAVLTNFNKMTNQE